MGYLKIIVTLVALALSFLLVSVTVKRQKNEPDGNQTSVWEQSYMIVGMVAGVGVGTVAALFSDKSNLAMFMSIGMLLGMVVGMNIKKR